MLPRSSGSKPTPANGGAATVGALPGLLLLLLVQLVAKDLLTSTADPYPYGFVVPLVAVLTVTTAVALRPKVQVGFEAGQRGPVGLWALIRFAHWIFFAIVAAAWLTRLAPGLRGPWSLEDFLGTGLRTSERLPAALRLAQETGPMNVAVLALALPIGALVATLASVSLVTSTAARRWALAALGCLGMAALLSQGGFLPFTNEGVGTSLALTFGLAAAARIDPPLPRGRRPRKRFLRFASLSMVFALVSLVLCGWAIAESRLATWTRGAGAKREWTRTERPSQALLDATVAMEDGAFFYHRGFDLPAIHRALRRDLREGRIAQGGSTLSQQLVKNLFLEADRTPWRKLKEAFLTVALERRLSKGRILEWYVDSIDYGQGRRGIQAAAEGYFHKEPSELTLAESATLAGLVPFAPKGSLPYDRIEEGRRTALSRVAFFFPDRYSPGEVGAAGAVPLQRLIYPLKDAWDRHASEETPPLWHGVATYFDLVPGEPTSLHMMHRSLRRAIERFLIEARDRLGIVGIDHVGVYNDRPQRGSASRLSAHAFGQAIDLTGFRFRDGEHVRVVDHQRPEVATRLAPVEAALRRHFDVVVDWREDPRRHSDHFHVEVRGPRAFPRRGSEDRDRGGSP